MYNVLSHLNGCFNACGLLPSGFVLLALFESRLPFILVENLSTNPIGSSGLARSKRVDPRRIFQPYRIVRACSAASPT